MSFYRLKQFQCEVTGRSGLDYFQALESEQQEARTMHSRFPEPLKAAVLKSVQWRTFLLLTFENFAVRCCDALIRTLIHGVQRSSVGLITW